MLGAKVVSAVYDPHREQLFTNIWNSGYQKFGLAFDAINGKPIGALRGHNATINSVTFSPDSLNVVTESDDSTS